MRRTGLRAAACGALAGCATGACRPVRRMEGRP